MFRVPFTQRRVVGFRHTANQHQETINRRFLDHVFRHGRNFMTTTSVSGKMMTITALTLMA